MLIGFYVAGKISDAFVTEGGHDWNQIWIYPAGFAAIVALIFLVLFKEEKINYKNA